VLKAYLCRGADCRKHSDTDKLSKLLDEEGVSWSRVRCQKICKAPVVGVEADGSVEWYARVRGKEGRRRLRKLLQGTKAKALKGNRVQKRSGKLR
jgi:(2Fe-2S) ferredoxin